MSNKSLALLIGLILTATFSSMQDFSAQCADVRENAVRLHVLANSDTEEDQALKLYVRDALLINSSGFTLHCTGKNEAEVQLAAQLGQMEEIAGGVLREHGCDDPVRAELVNMFFPTRVYEDIILPAGRYDAVRVTLGAGKGRNWWCVMFPPMCLPAAIKEADSPLEEQIRLLGAVPCYEAKFAVVELYETIREHMRRV